MNYPFLSSIDHEKFGMISYTYIHEYLVHTKKKTGENRIPELIKFIFSAWETCAVVSSLFQF